MADRPTPRISSRKEPRQARSIGLVEAVLQAAAQVLAEAGAQRFTTARVAERAGVSVGSLYQYFPNKAAILFRLQAEEWRSTGALLRGVLEDRTTPPAERLRAATLAFVRSEREEAALRLALGGAAPFYRDAPEAREPRVSGTRTIHAFLEEALPSLAADRRGPVGEVIVTALSQVGKRASELQGAVEVEACAEALADMLCAYLASLSTEPAPRLDPPTLRSPRGKPDQGRDERKSPLSRGSALSRRGRGPRARGSAPAG